MGTATDGGLILASASAARRRILADAGVPHRAVAAEVDEAAIKTARRAAGDDARACAFALAAAKALAVGAADPGSWVLGCDQMLDLDGDWLDKPGDRAALAAQLARLRGRTHTLSAAVVLTRGGQVRWRHVGRATLRMRAFSDEFLADYVAVAPPVALAAVGGYTLEGAGAHLFARVDGDLFTIMGLPLLPLLAQLRRIGYLPS
ncbi:Maf-like protein Rru_A3614 [uncultured Alphaproteobacteria bacterium]|uniref:Nucleoside triphosphate pyrophosphatase n=1 Tax=uncultured Alphaproteobacteria bacterium TaxID=91750 RepID=A0A212KBG1_9PROT|nr:Maf-like protein Rru_A3614 [uncultured Alphaproteobacteria bacterium]